jgi:hypothetical protein
MSNEVYANNMEVSCKAAGGKSVAAFPDVCMTPPQTPATPPGVPIPYPNTAMASDCADGSSTVQISGQEVMLKNKSYFKTSSGDEAGSAPMKGLVTHVNKGKAYFNAWSMDVKCEGENVVRHLDLATHNHASMPGSTPPWPYADAPAPGKKDPCHAEKEAADTACKKVVVFRNSKKGPVLSKGATKKKLCNKTNKDAEKCRKALRCRLEPQDKGSNPNAIGCCPGEQAHHIVESHGFCEAGAREGVNATALAQFTNKPETYRPGDAPCVCAAGDRFTAQHGGFHALVGKREIRAVRAAAKKTGGDPDYAWKYKDSKKAGLDAHKKLFPDSECSRPCMEAQLDKYHNDVGANENTPLRTEEPGLQDWQKESDAKILNQVEADLGADVAGTGF